MSNREFKIFDSDALKNIHKRVFFSITVFIIFYSLIFFQIFNLMIFSKYFNNELLVISNNTENINIRGEVYDRNGMLLASGMLLANGMLWASGYAVGKWYAIGKW